MLFLLLVVNPFLLLIITYPVCNYGKDIVKYYSNMVKDFLYPIDLSLSPGGKNPVNNMKTFLSFQTFIYLRAHAYPTTHTVLSFYQKKGGQGGEEDHTVYSLQNMKYTHFQDRTHNSFLPAIYSFTV